MEQTGSPEKDYEYYTNARRSMRRIRDAQHSCRLLESALDRNQWRPSLDTATGVWGPDGVARTIIQGPQMVEMSSGAVRGGPQRVGTAACKEQSSGGLSAVQLLAQKMEKGGALDV